MAWDLLSNVPAMIELRTSDRSPAAPASRPRRLSVTFVAMVPDETVLDVAREFADTTLRKARAVIERLGDDGRFRARVVCSRREALVEAADPVVALQRACDAVLEMLGLDDAALPAGLPAV